jgi:aspartyl-tRNA(Asn)/glutamyl-tRNA(Gln) amidotransferase subunit B
MPYQPVVGLEVHAEMQTRTKMFCGCAVVDTTTAAPNTSVCPVCLGLPGTLPVVNRRAVEYGLRVALALGCEVAHTSLFARKNYFYPDLPKGYQISQYEYPLAVNGQLTIDTPDGEQVVRIRRVHLEEDTGKLTHVHTEAEDYSLVDLNRAGVALLEIVSEPDMHSLEAVRAYATGLRAILRALGVNSGDMEKGVIRFEANVSLLPEGETKLGTRVEIKNLNSFRTMERAIAFEMERQASILDAGGRVEQETLGWDEAAGATYSQRSKEEAHDYRYFPEPDLPPLVVDDAWVAEVRAGMPELPRMRQNRFQQHFQLTPYEASLLSEQPMADFFEEAVGAGQAAPRMVALWLIGEVFGWLNAQSSELTGIPLTPVGFADLLGRVQRGEISQAAGKQVLVEMLTGGKSAEEIIAARGLLQVFDADWTADLVRGVLTAHPEEVRRYLSGNEALLNWLFGQVMAAAGGKANPQVARAELLRQLGKVKL